MGPANTKPSTDDHSTDDHSSGIAFTGDDNHITISRAATLSCSNPIFSMIDVVRSIYGTLSEEDKKLFKFASDAVEREKEKKENTEISILFRHRGALIVRSGGEKGAELKRVHVGFNEKNEPEWRMSVDEYAVENFHVLSDVIPRAVPV